MLILFLNCSACTYIGSYKEVYYYKYNNILKLGSYYFVFDDQLENYSNYKYLKIAEEVKKNLNALGFYESFSLNKSDYIVYYTYDITPYNKQYKIQLSLKIFDRKSNIEVLNKESFNITKKSKVVFDSNSILFDKYYNENQSSKCLIKAIFNKQILSKQSQIVINKKVIKEQYDISNSEGIYYCF